MPLTYEQLFLVIRALAVDYGLDEYLEGYTAELINILLRNHIDKLRRADSYETTMQLIRDALSVYTSVTISVTDIIPSEDGRRQFYHFFRQWREQLLAEVDCA